MRIGEEAVALLDADQCPSGTMDIVLSGDQVSLQIHESIGHALELDRVLGWEANFSGTSFATLDKLGTFRYGSDQVNVVIDMTCPLALATHGYDDEGVKATPVDLIRDGILVGYMAGRDTRGTANVGLSGCVRAEYWGRLPMIRIGNVNLEAGSVPAEQLFDDIKQGVYMESNRSWSIDDKRLELPVRLPARLRDQRRQERQDAQESDLCRYDAERFGVRATPSATRNHGLRGARRTAAKGEPLQTARSCQGASPTRFRNVAVGVGIWRLSLAIATRSRRSLHARFPSRRRTKPKCLIAASDNSLTRFTHNFAHESVSERNRQMSVRAVIGNRTGVAATNKLDDAGIIEVVNRACAIAKLSTEDADFPGLPGPEDGGRRSPRGF